MHVLAGLSYQPATPTHVRHITLLAYLVESEGAAHLFACRALEQGDLTQSLIARNYLRGALCQLFITQCSVGHGESWPAQHAQLSVARMLRRFERTCDNRCLRSYRWMFEVIRKQGMAFAWLLHDEDDGVAQFHRSALQRVLTCI